MKIRAKWGVCAATAGRGLIVGLVGAWLAAGCGVGGAETAGEGTPRWEDEASVPESAAANALRERFPEQAALVLEQGDGFVATEAGFVPDTASRRSARVALPSQGQEAIRIRGFGDAEVRVREIGAEGEGALAERAVAYPRAGGTSFWMTAPGGVEEWLQLEADAVRADAPEAAWDVEGATVRQRGEVVEVVDAGGVVRLSVTAPKAYAEGGREIGVRLVASGSTIALEVDAVGEAVLVDPQWMFATPMIQARYAHAAALLGSGKVLAAGGVGATSSFLAAAEVYDPATNAWVATGPMIEARKWHTATPLGSGEALVAGGLYSYSSYSTYASALAELYNPVTNTWTAVGSMSQARYQHTATLLDNGKVLAVGGRPSSGNGLATAEVYDPVTNTWSLPGAMAEGRYAHTATLLANGKVLVTGGQLQYYGTYPMASAELFDPATYTWSPAAPMNEARLYHAATLLPSGDVLVTGGRGAGGVTLASAEVYDPDTNTWSPAAAMTQARYDHSATLLANGKALMVSGNNGGPLLISEQYDEATDTWTMVPAINQGRYDHTAMLLGDGTLWVGGGYNGGAVATVELYSIIEPLGNACEVDADCESGFCVDGVCCDTACDAGACDACSVAAGAPADGTCAPLTGNACDDGDACTLGDTCQAGACTAGDPVTCAALDTCHDAGVCDPATGMCSNPAKVDGTVCDDGNACTQTDTCLAGTCTGGDLMICEALDACHLAGVCDAATGACTDPLAPNGTACQGGTCNVGVCESTPGNGNGGGNGGGSDNGGGHSGGNGSPANP